MFGIGIGSVLTDMNSGVCTKLENTDLGYRLGFGFGSGHLPMAHDCMSHTTLLGVGVEGLCGLEVPRGS